MANAGDACTAAKATFPMLSLNVKPKVFCAVLRARCACNPWLTSKGHKNLISKGEIGGKAWSLFAPNQTILFPCGSQTGKKKNSDICT